MIDHRLIAAALLLSAAPLARGAGFSPGEETVFEVRYLSLPTGEGRIIVGQPQGDIWPVTFQARTGGVAGFIDIREHLVSYWNASSQLTLGSDLRAYEIGDYHYDSQRFDRVNGKVTVSVQRKGRLREKVFPIPEGIQDLTSAFMWLRLQPLAPGDRYQVPVCAGDKQFTLVAEVLGREVVKTAAGTFPTVKVKAHTELEGNFSAKRDSTLWLSDDPRHLLVQASADFAVGSIVASLKSYRPGTEVASR